MDSIDTFINLLNNMEAKKGGQQILFGAKIRIGYIDIYKTQVIMSCTICRTDLIGLLMMMSLII